MMFVYYSILCIHILSILRQKIKVVLDYTIDDANARAQTLTYIANDYLFTMGEMIQAMLKDCMGGCPQPPLQSASNSV